MTHSKKGRIISIILVLAFLISCSIKEEKNIASPSDVSSLIGIWELEKQYDWDEASNQWIPGVILDDETATDVVGSGVINEFKLGGVNCPSDKNTYVSLIPSEDCYLVKANILESLSKEESIGKVSHEWVLKGENLEIITTVEDPTKTIIESGIIKSKTISRKH